jgi:hypothetical protein
VGRLIAGSIVVALVSWIWSVLFYVVSPIPYYTVSQTRGDRAAGQALLEHFPVSGTYILPDRKTDRDTRLDMRNHGPVATVYIKREGAPFSSPWKVIVGTLQGVGIGFLLGLAMRWLARIEPDFNTRVGIAAIFGLSYTIYPRVADIIWSDFPQGYQWMMIFSDGVSWLLMAAVMAWFTRPAASVLATPNQNRS